MRILPTRRRNLDGYESRQRQGAYELPFGFPELIRQIQLFFAYRCNMSLVRSPHLHRTHVFEAAATHRRHDMTEYRPESSDVLG